MALIDSAIVFLVSLVVGTIGIYAGARLVTGEDDFGYALVSALIGAVVWGIVGFLIGGLPFLGPLLTLLAWIAVINARYRGGWLNATLIGVVSWGVAVGVLYLMAAFGITTFEAIGIPGT
jgi:hypothetical protein